MAQANNSLTPRPIKIKTMVRQETALLVKFGWFCCAWELPKYGLQIRFEFKQKWIAFCQSQHEAGGRSIIVQVNLERLLNWKHTRSLTA
jgi:hypothetical protein